MNSIFGKLVRNLGQGFQFACAPHRFALGIQRHGYSLLSLLYVAAKRDDVFIQDDHEQISYACLYRQSKALAHQLLQAGIAPGEAVWLKAHNGIPWVAAACALTAVGAHVVLVHPQQTAVALRELHKRNHANWLLTDSVLEESSELPTQLCLTSLYAQTALVQSTTRLPKQRGSLTILSSGSQGIPKVEARKMAILPFISPALDLFRRLHLWRYKTVLISVPLFHGYGLAALCLSLFLQRSIVLSSRYRTNNAAHILLTQPSLCWVAVPLMLQNMLAQSPNVFHQLAAVVTGGDVLPVSVTKKLLTYPQLQISNLFGTSETGVISIANRADLVKYPDTLGRLINGVEYQIHDECGASTMQGCLWVRCAWASDHRKHQLTPTGDRVRINNDGYLFHEGRVDDMLLIGGENIYPKVIEQTVQNYPNIRAAQLVSLVDELLRPQLHLTVWLKQQTTLDECAFRKWLVTQDGVINIDRLIIEVIQD